MNALRTRLAKDERGFTLIELLVVVIIIGILAAIAIPTFLNQRRRGWQAELTSTVRNVALEVEAFATADGGSYANVAQADVTGFTDDIQGGATPVTITLVSNSVPEFCMTGVHASLTPGNIAYESDLGGLQAYSDAGTAGCTP